MNTIKIDNKQTKMVAHRGLSGLEKENTCAAFVAACNRESYCAVETDVHRTADGQFVIIHDDNTQRVGLDRLVVEESTFDMLRKLQLTDLDGTRGRIDLCIPTLLEYINICKRYEKVCVLELKNEFRASDVYKIVSIIDKAGYLDHVIFISFQLRNLVFLRRRYPAQPAQYLLKTWEDSSLETLKKYDLDLDLYYQSVTPEIVSQVHGAGRKVNCWTVNDPDAGQSLADMGVDYITTNILEGINAVH
ncbi:MAG: glycerophosphodiester phosphodiesterase family protein [Faecalibacterium sp.]